MRYSAFISYNHRDRKDASWLQRALETYRIPRHLHGRETVLGVLGARLPPIFQDREELAASSDLAKSVQDALRESASLVVVCSPHSATSQWVNEEIRAFTAMGRRDRVQCLIVDGEPNASRLPDSDPARECLPPALFEGGFSEPLASDIRPGQDGRDAAKLKLLAGILGVGYDELRQREQQRRQRRLAIVATASTVGFVAATALASFALISRQEAVEQRDLARQKTLTAERTVDFVKSMFALADPSEARGTTVTAREILDRGAQRINAELATEPSVKAELGTTLGEVYTNLGLFKQGDALITGMLRLPDVEPGTRARQYLALGEARIWQAQDQAAADALQKALVLAQYPRSDRSDLVPRILVSLGEAQGNLDQTAQARRNIERAMALDRARGAEGALDLARGLEALGTVAFADGDLDTSRASFDRALKIRSARQGLLHPRAMQDLNQLGSVAYMQGDKAAAEAYFRRALPLYNKVLGPDHTEVAGALNNIARVLVEKRDYRGAVPLLRRAVDIQAKQRDADTGELVFPLANLGIALRGSGDTAGARAALERARTIAAQTGHRNLAPVMVDLADLDCAQGQKDKGEALIGAARPLMLETYPDDPWRIGWLDLVDAACRGDRQAARQAASAVLAKWGPSTHYGARAATLR